MKVRLLRDRIGWNLLALVAGGALFLCACGGASAPNPQDTAAPISAQQSDSIPMPEATGEQTVSGAGMTLDASNTQRGYVMMKSAPNDRRLKTRVTGTDGAYNYEQRTDETFETYPLQMGDGDYAVQGFEQVEGTTYSRVFNANLTVSLISPEIPFLYPNQYVSYTRQDAAVAKSFELCQGLTDPAAIADTLYRYVVKNIAYDYDKAATVTSGYLPVPDETLASGKGICFDYSALLATMLRVQGIPARLEIGHVAPDNLYHAWNRVYINGQWVFFDATLAGEGRREQDYTTERIY